MAEEEGGEKRLEASARKLEQARQRGDVPISREGSAAALYLAVLLGILLTGGLTARKIADILLPLLDQPDGFLDLTPEGLRDAGQAFGLALVTALAPFFGFAIAAAILPYVLQRSIVIASERLTMKLSNLSPRRAVERIFGPRALFEFAKSIIKMIAVGAACFMVGYPIYRQSADLVALDPAAMPSLATHGITSIMFAVTLVAFIIAGIDVPYQHFVYRRKQRMSFQEMREEMRATDGDPHIKAKLRRLRRQRLQRRMMKDLPKATVVIANPTHFAVALKYDRGGAAPVVVAKGVDGVALHIRKLAARHNIPVVEDRPLARALYAAVEVGDMIPREHFEAVAKVIGLVWAQRGKGASSIA